MKGPKLKTSAMIASIAAEGDRTIDAPFGHALVELAKSRPDIVGMTADLGKYTDMHIFAAAHPDRFYQMGMAEQLLMASAAGMAREGFVPFVTTYAVFAARRAYDFIFMAIAEDRLNVKIACALPGLTTGYGPSHQATDDLAIFRAMPGLTIIDPCDALDIAQATAAAAAHDGPVYMRLLRGKVPLMLDEYDYSFEIGKTALLRDGSDVLFVSSGLLTKRALEACDMLRDDRIDAGTLHVPTIKPLDEEAIASALSKPGRLVVVAENHSVVGGFGEAVLALAARRRIGAHIEHIGLPDAFLDAGALPTLHDRYGISTAVIVAKVKSWL
jgi:transketolase